MFRGFILATCIAFAGTSTAGPPEPPPDILLVTTTAIGPQDLAAPGARTLARLGREGRSFSQARAHNTVTLPSAANILTGLYPYQHGVRDDLGFRLPAHVDTLATMLGDGGYHTAAFLGDSRLARRTGLDRGFDVYQAPMPAEESDLLWRVRPGNEVLAAALEWWGKTPGPRFLWLHLVPPDGATSPAEHLSLWLRPLLEPLDSSSTLVALTSVHGMARGEHGEHGHGLFAYDTTLRVPLLLWGAGISPAADPGVARHVDILPSLLRGSGIGQPRKDGEAAPGRSLLTGAPQAGDVYFEALSAHLRRGWAPLRGIIRGQMKAIDLPRPELYDLRQDSAELRNLAAHQPGRVGELLRALPTESAWPPGQTSRPNTTRLPDPKDHTELDSLLRQCLDLLRAGDDRGAVEAAGTAAARAPSSAEARELEALALLRLGQGDKALARLEVAGPADPRARGLNLLLGRALSAAGRAEDALPILRPLAQRGDARASRAYAAALAAAGRPREARGVLDGLLARRPDDPHTLSELARLALHEQRWPDAQVYARRAVDLDPLLAPAWVHLGDAHQRRGETAEALLAWRTAVDLDPGLHAVLFRLARETLTFGRLAEARAAFARFLESAPQDIYPQEHKKARSFLERIERTLEK